MLITATYSDECGEILTKQLFKYVQIYLVWELVLSRLILFYFLAEIRSGLHSRDPGEVWSARSTSGEESCRRCRGTTWYVGIWKTWFQSQEELGICEEIGKLLCTTIHSVQYGTGVSCWFKHILFITRHDRAEQKAMFSPVFLVLDV